MENRFWEIDFFRGCAIITMVIYHLLYDLHAFGSLSIVLYRGFWHIFQIATASTFLTVAGVSLALSYNRLHAKGIKPQFSKYFKRGLSRLGWGMVVTVFTYLALGEWYVRFGILHCIGTSIILGYFFLIAPTEVPALCAGIGSLFFGLWLQKHTFPFSTLLILGFIPANFYTVDYFPLFPWFGVVLLGIALGKRFYANYERRFPLPDWSWILPIRCIRFLGKHSLTIYLLHQPVIIALLFLLGLIRLSF